MSTSHSIFDTFQPFYLMARVFGLGWPWLKLPPKRSLFAITVATVWLVSLTIFQVYTVYDELNSPFWDDYARLTKSRLASDVLKLQLSIAILIGVGMVLVNTFNRSKILTLLESIGEIDHILAGHFYVILPYRHERRNHRIQITIIIICMLPVNVGSYSLLCALNTCYNQKSLVTNLISSSATFIFVAWAFALYNCVRTRFRWINSLFTQMMLVNSADKGLLLKPLITGDTMLDELLTIVTKLSQQHQRLCDCLRQINQFFALQLLVIISVYFAMGTYGLFYFIRGLANKTEEVLMLFLTLLPLFWTALLVGLVLVTLSITTAVVNEAKQTGIIVNRIIRRILNDTLVDQLLCVAEMIHASDVRVTCGLFNFDWRLISSITGSMTTYVLYLLQLDIA